MLGLIFSQNLLWLFIFWELTSICSFFLIGLKNSKSEVRFKAKWSLYTTAGGGLFLLLGVFLLSQIGIDNGLSFVSSFEIHNLKDVITSSNHPYYNWSIVAILIGIASKSALLPFSFWLPLAMAGPTPVSSFLHSATMVKAGLILAFKVQSIFSEGDLFSNLLVILGCGTALLAALQCFLQRNLKTMLAYSTTCVLGLLAVLLGLNTSLSHTAFITFVLAHALYKASLFQLAGYLDVRYGTMDFLELQERNIHGILPLIAVILSTLSMVGLPLTLGFFAKEYMYTVALKSPYSIILALVFFVSNLAMGIQAINFLRVFIPKKSRVTKVEEDEPTGLNHFLYLPALVYSITGFLVAVFPKSLGLNSYFTNILSSHLKQDTQTSLKLWHGLDYPYNIVLILSLLTIIGSVVGSFIFSNRLSLLSAWSQERNDFSLLGLAQKMLNASLKAFEALTSKLINGSLRQYLIIIILFYSFLLIFAFSNVTDLSFPKINFASLEFLTLILSSAGLFAAVMTNKHYRILINLALSGFFLVAFFVIHSAIDVSMTQLMVESLSLFFIFFLIITFGLKQTAYQGQKLSLFIAGIFGLSVALFALVKKSPFTSAASEFYIENSFIKAKGLNIVNVILVDFRALDTFGEVIVVAIAIIGVGAILRKQVKEGA